MKEYLLDLVAVAKDALQYYTNNFNSNENFQAYLLGRGWIPDDNIDISVVGDLSDFVNSVEGIVESFNELKNGLGYDDLEHIESLFDDVKTIYEFIEGAVSFYESYSLYPLNEETFWDELKEDFFDNILVEFLANNKPFLFAIFRIFDIIEAKNEIPVGVNRLNYTRHIIHWDKLGEILTNPKGLFQDAYHWNIEEEEFDYKKFMSVIEEVSLNLGLNTVKLPPTQELTADYLDSTLIESQNIQGLNVKLIDQIDQFEKHSFEMGFKILPILNEGISVPDGFVIVPNCEFESNIIVPLTSNINLYMHGAFASQDAVRFKFLPESRLIDFTGDIFAEGEVGFAGYFHKPAILLGRENNTRVELEGFQAGVGIRYDDLESDIYLKISTGISNDDGVQNGINFVVNTSDSDGFLKKIIGGKDLEFKTSADLTWSSKHGVSVNGAIGLEILLPTYEIFNGLSLESTKVRLGFQNGKTYAEVVTDIKIEIGPFAGGISEIGLRGQVSKAAVPKDSLLGDLDFEFKFKPPSGIGFSIDASAVKGGGFLYFNYDEEKYAGVAELSVKDKISLKAVGILTTKLPGNDDGYSLLLLITAEFTPINLAFGFTLNGVGGLVAINRSMNLQALRDGVKNNSIDDVMFPDDPVNNAAQIISNLETIFPVQEGRFVFGVMGLIGWGSPTVITMEIGLMLEVPKPIRLAILGVIKAAFGSEDGENLLTIQINFVGIIDFEAKYITFDASIFESNFLTFSLAGDMAFRLKWGDEPNFLFSVGGFHPSFTPPPLDLPSMERLTINFFGDEDLRLTLSTYIAITSNTVQLGALLDFYYKINNNFEVLGNLGFDILIQFSPFYLKAELYAMMSVIYKEKAVLSISLYGMLEGPTPWHAQGKAEFVFLKIKGKANFDKIFGEEADTVLPDVEVMPMLIGEADKSQNWEGVFPSKSSLQVTLKEQTETDEDLILSHPNGSLIFSQKIVPLETNINKFGKQNPVGSSHFSIAIADVDGMDYQSSSTKEFFAPADFIELTDNQKLTRKSFERMNGGVKVTDSVEFNGSFTIEKKVEYENIIYDSREQPERLGLVEENAQHFESFIQNNAAAKCPLGSRKKPLSNFAPNPVHLAQDSFTITHLEDLSVFTDMGGELSFQNEAEANSWLEKTCFENPGLADKIAVLPIYELV